MRRIIFTICSFAAILSFSLLCFYVREPDKIKMPSFSSESGFYKEAFALQLEAEAGATIYYTTDGSQPTMDSAVYQGSIWIEDKSECENQYAAITGITSYEDYVPDYLLDKGTVIRAMAVDAWGRQSDVKTNTYFIGFEQKSGYENKKVLSMVVEPDALFAYEDGIYMLGKTYEDAILNGEEISPELAVTPANYHKRGKDMEREAFVTLFDENGVIEASQKLGIRIHGGYSRSHRQKSFNFYTGDEYGEDTYGFAEYMLRTSGHKDSYQTMLRDVFNQSLVRDRSIAIQEAVPCILFINGEYWGLYNLQQRFTESYFQNGYGISPDNIICIKNGEVSIGIEEDNLAYQRLEYYAKHSDLSSPEAYEKIGNMMDIQNFIDYICFECYIANADWPYNNNCYFAGRNVVEGSAYEDGRWRWAAYDTDDSTNIDAHEAVKSKPSSNPFSEDSRWAGGNPLTEILMSNLMENEDFRKQFVLTFMDMANVNFDYATVHQALYEMAERYATAMVATQHRFNSMDYTEESFYKYVENIDQFYRERKDFVVTYLAEAFALTGTLESVQIDANDAKGGQVILNTTTLDFTEGAFEGVYFTDYPITLTAVPKEGYRFDGWEGDVENGDTTVSLSVTGGIKVKAVFTKVE